MIKVLKSFVLMMFLVSFLFSTGCANFAKVGNPSVNLGVIVNNTKHNVKYLLNSFIIFGFLVSLIAYGL